MLVLETQIDLISVRTDTFLGYKRIQSAHLELRNSKAGLPHLWRNGSKWSNKNGYIQW